MASSTYSTPHNKEKAASFPPKRGKIKAQIFNSLVKIVTSTVSKAGKFKGSGGDNSGGDSATSTPPPSDYNSDAS